MADNEGELVVERTERLRRLEDQQLRQAQDQAFQESLAADREKERQKEEDMFRAEELAREQRELQEQVEREKEVNINCHQFHCCFVCCCFSEFCIREGTACKSTPPRARDQ